VCSPTFLSDNQKKPLCRPLLSKTRETPRKPKPPGGVLTAGNLAITRPPTRLAPGGRCRSCRLRPAGRFRLLLAEPMWSPSRVHPGRTSSVPFGSEPTPKGRLSPVRSPASSDGQEGIQRGAELPAGWLVRFRGPGIGFAGAQAASFALRTRIPTPATGPPSPAARDERREKPRGSSAHASPSRGSQRSVLPLRCLQSRLAPFPQTGPSGTWAVPSEPWRPAPRSGFLLPEPRAEARFEPPSDPLPGGGPPATGWPEGLSSGCSAGRNPGAPANLREGSSHRQPQRLVRFRVLSKDLPGW
jgi:hypothetical protein